MSKFPARTVALFGVSAVTVLVASGCGSGDDPHGSHASGTATTITTSTTGTSGGGAATPTADRVAVDRAFVAQMIPHHEMAVAMAADTPARGEHPEIRALGRGVTTAQEREIAEMRAIAKRLGVTPDSMSGGDAASGHEGMDHGGGEKPAADAADGSMAADARTLGLSVDEMGMSMEMSALKTAKPFDRAFIDQMIPHHQGAIRMARAQLANGRDPELRRISQAIVAAQKREIAEMNRWRERWYGAPSPAGGAPPA
jgi:uncharacterized protein (DUF305 family)